MIDRRSHVPAYLQVADVLRARVAEVGPGGLLGGEQRLASEFDVGRDTMRQALAELRHEGLIDMTPQGARVRPEPELSDYSLQRSSRIRLRMPTPEERAKHDIPEGVPVAVIRYGARTILLIGDRHEMIVK